MCERKCKEYQGRAVFVSTDSRHEAKPNKRQLLHLTFIRYSQEVYELNPLYKSYLRNFETDLNSVLPLALYIKNRRLSLSSVRLAEEFLF